MLAGCYRRDEAADPDVYATAIAAVLADYPEEIVCYVTDPRTGLPSKTKWLPSVSEVKDACEYEMGYRFAGVRSKRLPRTRDNPHLDAIREGFRRLREFKP